MADTLWERLQAALGATYALERELPGGMSRVFVATEAALGRRVVVKVLPPERTYGVNAERFRREIHVAAQLQHPHIVPILTAGEAGDLLYYVMPFVAGESLRVRLASGPLPASEAVRILRDVASGLAFAHRLGIVHRDIKPDNVLLAGDSAALADFGIAKALSAAASPDAILTTAGTTLGTPAYMSPEQATGDIAIDHRADLYSLGAMAFEMLTGDLPFARATPQAVMVAHAIEKPPSLAARRPDLPPTLCGVVMLLLEKRPDARPQQAEEVLRTLDGIATPSGGSTTVSVLRFRPRRRWPLAVAATGAIAIAGFLWSRSIQTGAATERRPVLLTDFTARSADSTLAAIVTEALRSDLSQSPAAVLLSSDRVSEALARAGRDRSTRVDLALGRELAQREGAVATVGGEVSEVGGRVLLLARIVDPATGEDIGALRETAHDSTDVLEAIDRLSKGVRRQLGESARSLKAAQPLARATTTSVEALRKYTQALALKETSATTGDAAALLEEAVQLDTGFALAWRELYDLRPLPSGQWDALRHAMSNRGRLSPAERAFTEATYAEFTGDNQGAVTALRAVVRLDPGNVTAWGNLGAFLLYRMADDSGALSAYRRALDASGRAPGRFASVINAELANRHPEAARRVLDSLQLAAPGSLEADLAEVSWRSHFGEYRVADSIAAAALGRARGNADLSAPWEQIRRNLLLLRGRPAEADGHHRRYVEYLVQRGRTEDALSNEFAYAQLLSRVEGSGPAIEHRLDEALRRFPPERMNPLDPNYIFMASSAAWSGRPALAKSLLARWIAVQPAGVPFDSLGVYWVLGDIALSEGRYADAARFMGRAGDLTRGAENYYPHRGHPHDLLGNADSAIALYQGYLGRVAGLYMRLWWLDPAHLAETYEALGRNFETRGQADSSVKYYQALLDLWRDAEPSLEPKKTAIRQALARVTGEPRSRP